MCSSRRCSTRCWRESTSPITWCTRWGGAPTATSPSATRKAPRTSAETLRAGEVPVAYFRAAAVIGSGSESFLTVFHLVKRLPLMVTPRWVTTRTQPIAIGDAVSFLAAAADLDAPLDREIQIGGPDVTTYGGMIDELARALDRRPPFRLTVPVLTPGLSSLWIGLVTPVDAGVARPLIEGLSVETVVTDPAGMALLPQVITTPLPNALRAAVEDLTVRQ
jgi:uncharacterized protein YbjT (DUF2867 family)